MVQFFKSRKAVSILSMVFLSLLLSVPMARAKDYFVLQDLIVPSELLSGEIRITTSPDWPYTYSKDISNRQPVSAKVTIAWQYKTDDVAPIYDMATYELNDGVKVNLSQPRGSKSQSGSFTIEIPPYNSLTLRVASDGVAEPLRGFGSGLGAELRFTVQSVVFPPTLVTFYRDGFLNQISTRDTVLNTGVAAEFQPVRRGMFDTLGSPATVFSILPALPAGLSMNSDGVITGTPTTAQAAKSYTVTATRGGATSSKDITIEVVSSVLAKRDLWDVKLRMGGPISAVTPVVGSSGTQDLTYSISPDLPPGLVMSSETGTISGTPTAVAESAYYTVTVTDGVTSASGGFTLVVFPSADAPIATPEVVTWQAGEASEVTFTIRSDYIYIEELYTPYISLKAAGGGPELRGTPGYPNGNSVNVAGILGIKFSWDNPIPGTYSGETYFYTDGLAGSMTDYKVPFTLIVTGEKSDQTISISSTAPEAVAGGDTYTPIATASSDLAVDFSIDSASDGICEILAGVVSFLDAGLCVINADQAGDSANNAAPQVQQVVEVAAGDLGLTAQTVTFTSDAPTPTLGGSDYTPTVTATSGLGVQLVGDLESKQVCWPIGDKVVLLTAGSCTVHAEQVGNFQYAPAAASQTFPVADAVTATQAIANQALSSGSLITPFTPVTGDKGVGPLSYVISPTPSEGLSFSPTTGEITGTPVAPVAATLYTVTVSDTNLSSESATFTLTITDGPAASLSVASKGLTINKAASFAPVTALGGTGTLSYTISPDLPDELELDPATGLITGTPTATAAASNFTVTVTDENSRTDTATFALTVNDSVVATQSIPSPRVTQGFAATAFRPVTGSEGTAALTYAVTPDLPEGLTMNGATGQISGTATAASDAATYTVTVTDANADTDTATFSLTVDGAVAATQAVAAAAFTKDTLITAFTPVTGAGGRSPLTYTVSPDLPEGLKMESGAISGTPTATSSATLYTVTVTDANTASATATFTLTINDAVVATQAVASKTLSANVAAIAFTPVTGLGGTGTLAYTVSPDLPEGLDMDEDSGEISGIAAAGSSAATYTVTVTDDLLATDAQTFTLSVNGPVVAATAIATTQLPVDSEVTPFTPVTGTGGTGDLDYSVSPNLPDGLSMDADTGAITGTPNTPTATATYTVTVTDENSTTDTADFSLSVATIPTLITLVASNTAPQPGEEVTLTATVTPSQATGSVIFKNGGTTLGSVPLASGVAIYATTDLGIGTHVLTAEYAGSWVYDGSTSSSVTVSLRSPSSEFESSTDDVTDIVQNLATSALASQVQNAKDAVGSAIGRMIDTTGAGSNVVMSSRNAPLEFHGDLNATDDTLNVGTNFFGQKSTDAGAKRRLVFGTFQVNKTDGGTVSAHLNARMAWEWSASDRTVLGYWFGVDAVSSDISNAFVGTQTSLGLGSGIYGIAQVEDSIFFSGFASLGQGKRFLHMGNTVLDLTSDYSTQNRVIGTALTASIQRGRVEWRPEFGLSYGQMDIGAVNFVGTAYDQTDATLSADMGNVSVAGFSFTPKAIIRTRDQTSSLTLSPHLDCQQVKAHATTRDCGGGASVAFEHNASDGLTTYFAKIRSDAISGVVQTSIELNFRQQF